MPRNIDDIEEEDLFSGGKSAQDTALRWKFAQLEAAKGMAGMKTFSRFVEEASKNMEKLAANISGSENLFGPGIRAFSKYQKTIEDQLQQKIKMGNSMASIESNMYTIADMRLKALAKIAKEEKMTAERRNAIEGTILKELEAQQVHERNLNKSKQLYSQAINKISSFLGGGSMSKAFETWAGKHEGAITGKMASDIGAGTGFGAAFEKIAGSLTKIAPAIILIGGAIAFLTERFVALFKQTVAFDSEIVKATGIRGWGLGETNPLRARITAAAQALQTATLNRVSQVEALKKSTEAAGGLSSAFGGDLKAITESNIKAVNALSDRLGISAEEAGRMVYMLERGAGISESKIAPAFAGMSALAIESGVSLNTILKDVTDNAALLRINTNGTADAFARAAINARLMGTTLESQQATARGFQTWEGAAEKAVQLTFLTGQRFNALALYTQANFGSSLSMQEQMLRSVRATFESQSTSRIRREMIAQQLGLGSAAEMQARYSAMDAEARITQKAMQTFSREDIAGFKKAGTWESIRSAIKMGGPLDAESIKKQADILRQKAQTAKAQKTEAEAALGLGELTTVTDQILGQIFAVVDKILGHVVGEIVPLLTIIAHPVDSVLRALGIPTEAENIAAAKEREAKTEEKIKNAPVPEFLKGGTPLTAEQLKEFEKSRRPVIRLDSWKMGEVWER